MSASGYTPIQLYYSTSTGTTPSSANLANGELAINVYDGKLFYKNSNTGNVTLIASSANASASVSSVGVSVPSFLSVSNSPVTTSGTIAISYSGTPLPVANGGTGAITLTGAGIVTLNDTQTVANKTLTTVTITNPTVTTGSFTNPTVTTGSFTSPSITTATLTNPTVTNYVESVVAIGTVTTASTISLTSGTVQTATLTASTACTFTMPTATAGKSFVILLKQAATTGNGSATFTGVKWNSAGAPTITTTAGKMDILSFVADGTNWYGSYTQGYTP